MKLKYFSIFILLICICSCSKNTNDPEFIKKVTGRYLYNSDEVVEVYFKENELYMVWRGAKSIKPLKVNENTFYVKEMNEKVQFLTNPDDKIDYIVLVPKDENNTIKYNYRKLENHEKIPREYLKNNEFEKALEGYLAIKEKDSLDPLINEGDLNSLGYRALRENNINEAINIFKINVALHPTSYNVYDSLGEALLKSGDTVHALVNLKKSLVYDSGNKRIKETIKRLELKE
jgi:tetratricopeptide (TPR) repeat protein